MFDGVVERPMPVRRIEKAMMKRGKLVTIIRMPGATDRTVSNPNVVSVVAIVAIVDIGAVTLAGATLSFLGLGISPPYPEWGAMVSDGITRPQDWWLTTFPGIALVSYVIGINLYGEVLAVELIAYLRGEQKFADTDALKAQIAADCEAARRSTRRFRMPTLAMPQLRD